MKKYNVTVQILKICLLHYLHHIHSVHKQKKNIHHLHDGDNSTLPGVLFGKRLNIRFHFIWVFTRVCECHS